MTILGILQNVRARHSKGSVKFVDHIVELQWPLLLQTKVHTQIPPIEVHIVAKDMSTMNIYSEVKDFSGKEHGNTWYCRNFQSLDDIRK